MLLKPRRLDDVVILDLSGRITIGEGTLILRDHIGKDLPCQIIRVLDSSIGRCQPFFKCSRQAIPKTLERVVLSCP